MRQVMQEGWEGLVLREDGELAGVRLVFPFDHGVLLAVWLPTVEVTVLKGLAPLELKS